MPSIYHSNTGTKPNIHHDVILQTAGLSAAIVLAEPTIFLSGFSKHEQHDSPPALVRGSLILRITKPKKIKSIILNFNGVSRTEWPEGIPSEKHETHETKDVFNHEWRMFSVQQKSAATSSGAHTVSALDSEFVTGEHHDFSVGSHSAMNQQEAINKGYRLFNPAEYVYNFELMLPHTLPETMKCNFGTIKWGFNLEIDRHGKFKPKLNAYKEVQLLRTLGPSNLESSEPIVINRDWEDLLHYEIIIAGKAFAIGNKFNVGISLVRLSKVKCHRLRLYISEHTEYFCRKNRIHRVEPSHKFLLMEHKSPEGSRGDLLQQQGSDVTGATEFEFDVEIPTHFPSRRDYLRPNANTESIKVYHWIKVVMRLSRQDKNSPSENKCYEVSIDSPITLLDAQTLLKNELPNYNSVQNKKEMVDVLKPYQKFIQEGSQSKQRAILYSRKPSVAPPPFDADERPPSLQPPQYDDNADLLKSYKSRYERYLRARSPAVEDSDSTPTPPSLVASNSSTSSGSSGNEVSDQPEELNTDVPPDQFSVFSEIFWREEEDGAVDPHEEPQSRLSVQLAEASIEDSPDETDTGNETNGKRVEDDITPPVSAPEQYPPSPKFADATDMSASPGSNSITIPIPASPRLPLESSRSSPKSIKGFSQQRNSIQIQRLRNSMGSSSNLLGVPASPSTSSASKGSLSGRYNPSGRKTPSIKAPQTPRSPTWNETASQLFGERWMDRRDSMSSVTSNNPRYFRQSSVVSVDLSRQGDSAGWDSRRPSRVSEIHEMRDWHQLSRTNSTSSMAVSIAEYQLAERGSSPLLRDSESEMDIGLEWENDFEDFNAFDNDRRSVVSAFYTVMTP